ncbi:DUF1513 domain-containing protein [uncultured Roseobacter sp.]|uniref:DUF1513 domain-containing protein n=1 Tax=uncultured Roseobacter sp. TaxID=114847 RepID=UPI0026177C22|nr:DUF1513 domain-containing protein [uncultured Roseobacter sp.]
MPSRRKVISGALAAATLSGPLWADVGNPTHLSAARTPEGAYILCGLRADGSLAFSVPLPDRGHAAAAHPSLSQAVAFARRPGVFAVVLDCATGISQHRIQAPAGRHFYGHGAFSRDGKTLFTTENDIDTGAGRIGVWDAADGYRRIADLSSNGIGPHEIIRLPNSDILAIANGGIRTHPASGRDKLNVDTMQPNLTLMDAEGRVRDTAVLPAELHQNSLRHIAAFPDGRVACAFQWQGDPFAAPSIAGVYAPEDGLQLAPMSDQTLRGLDGYAGSVAVLGTEHMAVTFPRGGLMQRINVKTDETLDLWRGDVCGVAPARWGGLATDGLGGVQRVEAHGFTKVAQYNLAFDNHLVAVGASS